MLERLLATFVASIVSLAQPPAHQRGVDLSVSQTKCLAETIYFESRGEGLVGSTAVAYVALNRTAISGESICSTVHKRGQFSYYNPRHPRIAHHLNDWTTATYVAVYTQLGLLANPIGNATMYNTTRMPSWTDDAVFSGKINHHYFYTKKVDLRQSPLVSTDPDPTVNQHTLTTRLMMISQREPSQSDGGLSVATHDAGTIAMNDRTTWSAQAPPQTPALCGAGVASAISPPTTPIPIAPSFSRERHHAYDIRTSRHTRLHVRLVMARRRPRHIPLRLTIRDHNHRRMRS